jgi:hypothetical protein
VVAPVSTTASEISILRQQAELDLVQVLQILDFRRHEDLAHRLGLHDAFLRDEIRVNWT